MVVVVVIVVAEVVMYQHLGFRDLPGSLPHSTRYYRTGAALLMTVTELLSMERSILGGNGGGG